MQTMAKKKTETKTEAAPVPETKAGKALEVAVKALKKQYGEDVVGWMSKMQRTDHELVSTGSITLDAALGVGGLVKGRIYEFYGPNASGKTTLALSIIKQVQDSGGRAIYVDAEHTLDKNLLVKMGIDPEKVALVQGYTGEQNLDIAEALMATGEADVCVIDSISALQPSAEANLKSFDDQTMGLHPRLMSRMCRTFTPLASRTQTALILINQIRANIGGYGPSETTSGGNAIQHHVSGRIRVTGGGVKTHQIKNSEGVVIGHRVTLEVTKNKLAPPYRLAEVDLIYGVGFYREAEILELGVDMGLIDQAGAWFSINGEGRWQGKSKALAALHERPKLISRLTKEISEILGLPFIKDE